MAGWFKRFALCMALVFITSHVHAEHAAIAYVDGGGWGGWAVKPTRKAAEAEALAGCSRANPGKKCTVGYASGIARAEGANGALGIGWDEKSKAQAEKHALKSCADSSCKTVWSIQNPGFFAVWAAMDNGEIAEFWLQHGANTGHWALEEGKRGCEQRFAKSCQLVRLGAMKGSFSKPAAAKSPAAAPSCRPKTDTIRCSSNCVNGDCVITYENGCKMRVQVAPQFNGASWVYPAPSC